MNGSSEAISNFRFARWLAGDEWYDSDFGSGTAFVCLNDGAISRPGMRVKGIGSGVALTAEIIYDVELSGNYAVAPVERSLLSHSCNVVKIPSVEFTLYNNVKFKSIALLCARGIVRKVYPVDERDMRTGDRITLDLSWDHYGRPTGGVL